MSQTFNGGTFCFTVPPRSAALNARLESNASSLTALAAVCSQGVDKFPLVVLDPPWPNRSARRKASYQSYAHDSALGSLSGLVDLLLDLQIQDHMTPDGFMAVWVTNKDTVRTAVLDIFAHLNVHLQEEWIWAKVTESGEPMCDLHGLWRQPWEVLMVGQRRMPSDALHEEAFQRSEHVRRRVICAVPDMHSRKPCLRTLFELLLFKNSIAPLPPEDVALSNGSKDPRHDGRLFTNEISPALELFARHMVAGWFSWGDEAIKYQWDGWWTEGRDVG